MPPAPHDPQPPGAPPLSRLGRLGPGIAIAATGVGAGDLIAASVGGLRFGTALLWAVALGAVLKYVLNEGIARWQLSQEQSVLTAVVQTFPPAVRWYLTLYFLVWTPAVAAALAAACGIAAAALWPVMGSTAWGVLHSAVAIALVLAGGYAFFERAMKGFIGVMFVCMVGSAVWIRPELTEVARGLVVPLVPAGSIFIVLSVMGGVGGSVTLLAYGTWIREKGWRGPAYLGAARTDLGVAYLLTGLFGVAVMVLASTLGQGPDTGGTALLIGLAELLGTTLGAAGRILFLVGVWAAVFTSMLGVWHGVPAILADFVHAWRRDAPQASFAPRTDRLATVLVLVVGALAMGLVTLGRPLWLIFAYTVIGSFFMPFLAYALLRLNSRRGPLGRSLGYGPASTAVLVAILVLFALLGLRQLVEAVG